ncbi:class I SAM-dependent methyltransferase [Ornithinibacillus salinisoli]|uniref:Class I SAM-dependent methyltransferase n=1 Tax=Ornithinibacillus salinisoli TaxID=1848459 RepID=A0ABW4W256_9BACI
MNLERAYSMYNFEEYDDPVLYDRENDSIIDDIVFLKKWAKRTRGKIIDLACGTGRATIPLARNGHQMIGVDVHKGMLEEARRKSTNLTLPIDFVLQDCTALNLNVKSSFIFSVGNSFQHFLTNEAQDGLIRSVSRHLEVGGLFIFDTRFPKEEELLQPSGEEFWRSYIDRATSQQVDVYTKSEYDALSQIQHYTTIRRLLDKHKEIINEKTTSIRLRYVFPKEMERLLSPYGLEIVNIYSDWEANPLTKSSDQMVYLCRKI